VREAGRLGGGRTTPARACARLREEDGNRPGQHCGARWGKIGWRLRRSHPPEVDGGWGRRLTCGARLAEAQGKVALRAAAAARQRYC